MLHTNDIHSHFEETSRIASYVAHARSAIDPDKLILVDCGDFLDRARMETEGTQAAVNRAALERIGYDAVALGNNEGLSYTPSELESILGGMTIPYVCANMKLLGTGRPPSWMTPSLTLVKKGVKIGLIGLTAPFDEYYRLLGWEVDDPIEALKTEAERLRPEVDVLILLSHLGLRQDERIAAVVEGIDLILGGHTHHLLETPLIVGSTAICAAGKFGAYIGRLELELGEGNKLLKVTGGCLATDAFPASPGMDKLISDYGERAKLKMQRRIATLSESMASRHDAESSLPTLLACAIRRLTGAEIGLVNAGQLLEDLPAGEVTEKTIHAICPSPINPCAILLRGDLILRSLEESLLPEFQNKEIKGFGFRGRVLGMLCADGLEATADLKRDPYRRIQEVRVNGEILDVEREYVVGTLDMFTFGVGYLELKEGRDIRYFLPEFIRDVLSEALNDPRLVEASKSPRWHFIDEL
ncbi:bifunctional metallophosphatase/5'-nucleotidase [Cohnella terricola]|uniref:Bifunctional metallophosphatase/5'-nucleotidase n=1 Tax=Cohnella terricola TaxID=1289167 RepID=A0A559JC14_9BACL|nr:bifunctional metallophosphatase/5'-nucleotidase [Cohnella terricola]